MIVLIASLPADLIEAVGPAPGFGRTRWAELSELLAERGRADRAQSAVMEPAFPALSSNDRFKRLYDLLRQAPQKPRSDVWNDRGGRKLVLISENERN
jgi:ParB family chromosome partitioning protein